MSLVKDLISGLAEKGKMDHEFTVLGMKFEMELLSTEEILIADTLVDLEALKKKYGADDRFNPFSDAISKQRTLSQMSYAIKKVNGVSPVDESLTAEEQFVQRMEFRDELATLELTVFDQIVANYRKLVAKRNAFFEDLDENVKK